MDSTNANPYSFDWSYPVAFVWGLLVLGAVAGWGRAVTRWLLPVEAQTNVRWGLAAAWGLATFLVLSGPMLMLEIFSQTFVALFLLAGLFFLAKAGLSQRKAKQAWQGPTTVGLKVAFVGLCLLALLTYAGAIAHQVFNSCDDFAAYFAFSKMMLDVGTLCDPFNFRMLGSLGGQPALSTLVVGFIPWKYANVLDMGIAGLIMLLLVQEFTRNETNPQWGARLLLVAVALTYPIPRINTASELTGVVLFMALFHAFALVAAQRVTGWRAAVLLGGVMTATSTLRAHNIFVVGLLGGTFYFGQWLESGPNRARIFRAALMTLAVSLLLLAPWWEVTYRSSGSFLFPLFKGTLRPQFETFNLHLSLWYTFLFVGNFFFFSTTYLLLFIPVCLLGAGSQRRLLRMFGRVILLISAAFVSQYTYGTYFDLYRYLMPIGLAFGLYTAGVVASQMGTTRAEVVRPFSISWRLVAATLAVLFVAWNGTSYRSTVRQDWTELRRAIYGQEVNHLRSIPPEALTAGREYEEAFARIPKNSKTLIALDYPYLLDYRAHPIFSVDVAGAASPEPGMPYFQGPEAVKKYLLSQGIRYIAHVPFSHSEFLHSRDLETRNLNGPVPMWHFYATFELDFFDNIDQLAKSNPVLYDSPSIRVIDLND